MKVSEILKLTGVTLEQIKTITKYSSVESEGELPHEYLTILLERLYFDRKGLPIKISSRIPSSVLYSLPQGSKRKVRKFKKKLNTKQKKPLTTIATTNANNSLKEQASRLLTVPAVIGKVKDRKKSSLKKEVSKKKKRKKSVWTISVPMGGSARWRR
jgi:hypothetical protein